MEKKNNEESKDDKYSPSTVSLVGLPVHYPTIMFDVNSFTISKWTLPFAQILHIVDF